jgi:hypothetical protein
MTELVNEMNKHHGKKAMDRLIGAIIFTFIVVLIATSMSGCAGNVKKYNDAGEKIEQVPAAVAVMQAAAEQMEECPQPVSYMLTVDDITKLSASAQAEAMRAIPMIMLISMIQTNNENCYTAIAAETKAFFVAQAAKYNQWGSVGRAGVIAGFSYLGAKSLFDAFAAASSAGDISIGTLNATKSDDPILGEGGGTASVNGDQVINIGGTTSAGRSQLNSNVDKAIGTPLDGDSNFDGNGNPTGIVIDDRNDGSDNAFEGIF